MANTLITPTMIARTALATLYNTTVLAPLVWRDYDPDFTGKQGDTVTVRKPATFTAEEFNSSTGITLQDATETSDTVVLNKIANVSFAVTDKELTLSIEDFAAQLLNPAAEAIVQKIDGDLAEALVDAAEGVGGGGTVTKGTGVASTALIEARKTLNRNKLPTNDRFTVLSPEAAAIALQDPLFVQADRSGSTDALREASIGRVFGMDSYESQVFGYGANDKGQADGVAFQRSAVILATRPLATPRGIAANQVAVESYKGLTLRTIYAYNNTYKRDEVSIDLLYGTKAIRPVGAVQLNFGEGS
jgi:hypothetical protein